MNNRQNNSTPEYVEEDRTALTAQTDKVLARTLDAQSLRLCAVWTAVKKQLTLKKIILDLAIIGTIILIAYCWKL
jgi:hypothetical protein